jgi:uncharacterized membrane protein
MPMARLAPVDKDPKSGEPRRVGLLQLARRQLQTGSVGRQRESAKQVQRERYARSEISAGVYRERLDTLA